MTSERKDTRVNMNGGEPVMNAGGSSREHGCRLFEEDLPTTLSRVEREMIVVALRASRGNKARAALALGISERLMGLRVKKHDIDPRSFRTAR